MMSFQCEEGQDNGRVIRRPRKSPSAAPQMNSQTGSINAEKQHDFISLFWHYSLRCNRMCVIMYEMLLSTLFAYPIPHICHFLIKAYSTRETNLIPMYINISIQSGWLDFCERDSKTQGSSSSRIGLLMTQSITTRRIKTAY